MTTSLTAIKTTLVLLSLVLLGACSSGPSKRELAKEMKNPVEPTSESLAAGKVIYDKECATCHGATGNGVTEASKPSDDTKPADLTDDAWTHGSSDGEVFVAIRDGIVPKSLSGATLRKGPMKGLSGKEGVTEQDIWNVVNFMRTLQKGGKGV